MPLRALATAGGPALLAPDRARPLLTVAGLSRIFADVQVLNGVDLDVGWGEAVAVIGPNGSGKTTLLRCVAGADKPSAGTVELCGRPLREHDPSTHCQRPAAASGADPDRRAHPLGRRSTKLGFIRGRTVNTHLLAVYVVAVFAAMIAPGPDMLFILATGARGGPRAGLLATLGVMTSEILQITAVAAGLAALFAAAPTAFLVVRLCGAVYLLYLGVQALRSARRGSPLKDSEQKPVASGYAYLRGMVTNFANPKSVTFVVALLPQFVDRSLGHLPLQFAVLGAIFIAFEAVIDGTVGLMAGRIGGWLSRRRRARQALDAGAGTIMVALAARLAAEH